MGNKKKVTAITQYAYHKAKGTKKCLTEGKGSPEGFLEIFGGQWELNLQGLELLV